MTSNRSSLRRSPVRRASAVAAAAAAALVLAACGSDGGSGAAGHNGHPAASPSVTAPATPGRHNAADVAFATGMIPHHRQAVEMADLAPGRAESGQVKRLAEEIKKAQDPEIRTLSGWLASWGEPVPAADAPAATDHTQHGQPDGSGGSGGGMMSAQEMDELSKASGKAFDTAFMELMIKHHEGAVEMAKAEKSQGSFADARTMADAIISSQSAEIDTMKGLLGKN